MKQRHYVQAALLWFLLTFILELVAGSFIHYPSLASVEGVTIDDATQLLVVLAIPVFAFLVTVIVYSVIYFRARGMDDLEPGTPVKSDSVALVWAVITSALAFTVIVYPGFEGLNKIWSNPTADLVVKVTGSQWSWRVEYPDGTSSREELVLPVGRRVKFEVTSLDVQHSFWIPAFRMKVDAVPGMTTEMYTTPTQTGSGSLTGGDQMLRVQCAELCGLNHATMSMPIRVVEQDEFDAMFGVEQTTGAAAEAPAAEADAAARGAAVADENGCVACHSVDGSVIVGPSWLGIFGEEVTLEDGSAVTVDEAYLRESIMDPNAKVVKGFPANIMPQTFGDTLSGDQIDSLIAYIKSLGAGE